MILARYLLSLLILALVLLILHSLHKAKAEEAPRGASLIVWQTWGSATPPLGVISPVSTRTFSRTDACPRVLAHGQRQQGDDPAIRAAEDGVSRRGFGPLPRVPLRKSSTRVHSHAHQAGLHRVHRCRDQRSDDLWRNQDDPREARRVLDCRDQIAGGTHQRAADGDRREASG